MSNTQKIFCIGLSKTGTTSLTTALDILGYRTNHALHGGDCQHNSHILDIINGKIPTIFNDFDVFLDIPICDIYQEANEKYHDAKFIFTTRELAGWLDSCEYHFNNIDKTIRFNNLRVAGIVGMKSLVRLKVYGCTEYNKKLYRNKYIQHAFNVMLYFNNLDRYTDIKLKEKLLIMNICNGDGWEKLCPFLNREIPNIPFPHENKRDES